jgi:IS30 family transposase
MHRSLYVQARGALKKELLDNHGTITDAGSISERPATADDRAIPRHWEGDLLFGSHNSQIATLVERKTRYVMLVKVARQGHRNDDKCLDRQCKQALAGTLQVAYVGSGKGNGRHKRFTMATEIQVYFCDPKCP